MTRRAAFALGALVMIVVITVAWWAFALWPTGSDAPAWLERTRAVCFGVADGGLPDAAGWVVLISEPLGMLAFLLLVWRDDLTDALGALRRTPLGRTALGATVIALVVGLGAATIRVAGAAETANAPDLATGALAGLERMDRPAPPLSLVDQHGRTVRLDEFRGRPVVIVFAYAHCQTVCPLLVHDAIVAVEQAKVTAPVLLVVTLDPWRDTPTRLPAIAEQWRLPRDARALGGEMELVTRALDMWQVARERSPTTGELAHTPIAYLLDRRGRIAYRMVGSTPALGDLLRTL